MVLVWMYSAALYCYYWVEVTIDFFLFLLHFIVIFYFYYLYICFENVTSQYSSQRIGTETRVFHISLNPCPFYKLAGISGDKLSWHFIIKSIEDSLANNTPIGSCGRASPKCWWCLARNIPVAAILGWPYVLLLWTMLWSVFNYFNLRLPL